MRPFDWPAYARQFGLTADSEGIARVQGELGMHQTGQLDPVTVNLLARIPRCGCTDAELAAASQSRWGIRDLTYFIASYPVGLGLSQQQVRAIVRRAFDSWEAVCNLKFTLVDAANKANILLNTGRGARSNFDGPSGTLAWCELPPGNNFKGRIEMRWDLDESWTDSPNTNGILLLNVTAHELGHGIGLSHNSVKNNLLNPYYNPRIATPQSHDIQDARSRYGAATSPPTEPTTPTDPVTPDGSQPSKVKVLMADGTVWGGTLERINPALVASEGATW